MIEFTMNDDALERICQRLDENQALIRKCSEACDRIQEMLITSRCYENADDMPSALTEAREAAERHAETFWNDADRCRRIKRSITAVGFSDGPTEVKVRLYKSICLL